jgi:thiol-disulfide isomerase/thioredoxin
MGAKDFKLQVKWNNGETTEEEPSTLMSLNLDEDDGEVSMDDDFEGENFEDESKEENDTHNASDFVFNFGESKVVKPTKLEAFNKALEDTDKLVVVLFGETWNMQCAQMMNTLDTFSNQFNDVTFVYVNVEEFKPSEANDSTSYPSFRIIHKKKVLSMFEGSFFFFFILFFYLSIFF